MHTPLLGQHSAAKSFQLQCDHSRQQCQDRKNSAMELNKCCKNIG